jgi:mono/diheme cytochrome c family protein
MIFCSGCLAAEPVVDPDPGRDPSDPPLDLDAGAESPISDPTWWQHVEPLVRSECHLCHGPRPLYGAPMSLVTYEDALAVHARVAARIQRSSGQPPMPPAANGHLTDQEIALIALWSKNGAPEGTPPPSEGQPDGGVAAPDSGHEEPEPPEHPEEEPYLYLPVVAPQAAIRPNTEDLYGCFRTVIETDRPLHVVEIEPMLDELEVVHHILLFRDGGRNYPEQKTGLLCAADTVLQGDWELLHGWAPGGGEMILPPEAGMKIEDGEHLVVQIHYNNPGEQTLVDASGMMLKATAALRANDAATLGVSSSGFSLPPGQPAVTTSGECTLTQPMKIFGYSPHMHLLGRGATLELVRGGQTTTLVDVQSFAFESQILYPAEFDLLAGDVLRVTCTFDTTSRTQTTSFGEGTQDEMCFMFVGHYPPFGAFSCGD